jgi:hypothetical protein
MDQAIYLVREQPSNVGVYGGETLVVLLLATYLGIVGRVVAALAAVQFFFFAITGILTFLQGLLQVPARFRDADFKWLLLINVMNSFEVGLWVICFVVIGWASGWWGLL